jgi:hypothetical protein
MSNIDFGIHWVDGVELVPFCDHDGGSKSFHLKIATHARQFSDKRDVQEITLFVNANAVATFERIAAAIAEITANENVEA